MTFFENQINARRSTSLLIALYALAVACLITAIYFAVLLVSAAASQAGAKYTTDRPPVSLWNPELFVLVAAGLLLIIVLGSWYKILQLREGGAAVARMLGGRLILPETNVYAEKRVLNIVEETALASGMKVPPVYILEREQSINAFAAGITSADAVVAVSRGCLQLLNRDELQGVIAHEFSHIANGDMALNLRLMGILHGILVIALTGYVMVRITYYTSNSRSSSEDRGMGLAAAIAIVGITMALVGYIGVFFGKLIKMAVARQREYLADSSAVQFTRNPLGIAGALKKIGGLYAGSRIQNPQAEQASHMFFANGLRESWFNLLATHPPLAERIKRIDPNFDGKFPDVDANAAPQHDEVAAGTSGLAATHAAPLDSAAIVASVGTLSPQGLNYARSLLDGLPAGVRSLTRSPYGACALIYALLLDPDQTVRTRQLNMLFQNLDADMQKELTRVLNSTKEIDAAHTLPLVDLCLPTLKLLSKSQYTEFRRNVQMVAKADQRTSILEYTLYMILAHGLDPIFLGKPAPQSRNKELSQLVGPVSDLLFALAFLGNQDPQKSAQAYQAGAECCGIHPSLRRDAADGGSASLEMLDTALQTLVDADLELKEPILTACIACINADGIVSMAEAELVRAVSAALDCPMPPFFRTAEISV